MHRPLFVVSLVVLPAFLVSGVNAGSIEVTATGHVERLEDWPEGLVVGDPAMLSYVVDLDDPHPLGPSKAFDKTGYTATNIFFEVGEYSISRNGPWVDAVRIYDLYDPTALDSYQFGARFESPFMGVEPFVAGFFVHGVLESSLHPTEIDVTDFSMSGLTANRMTVIPEGDGVIHMSLDDIQIHVVPDPATLGLLLFGVLAVTRIQQRP